MLAEVEAAGLFVDMRDPQALQSRVGRSQAIGEKGPRGGQAVQFQGQFGTLIAHRREIRPNLSA
jgi:hypothetical protein